MKFSCITAIFVTVLVTAAPLLACLPTAAMTPAEMECCKKMAGNCDMGGGNHACCDMTINHSAPTAAVAQNSTPHAFVPCVLSGAAETELPLPQFVERNHIPFIRISSSPPDTTTVFRL